MYDISQIHEAHSIFLHLLQHKVAKKTDTALEKYFHDMSIQQLVKRFADTSSTQVLVGNMNVHLVTKPKGSIFATNFTQMKEQMKERKSDGRLETRLELYVIHLVIMVYLSEVDGESVKGSHIDLYGGIRYIELTTRVSEVIEYWSKLLENDPEFGKRQKIAMPQLINLWETTKLQPDEDEQLRANNRTKFGIVQMAMRLLEQEKLVKITDQRVSALEALHERVEMLYHSEQRYQEWKRLIDAAAGRGER
ncbi:MULTISPECIES: DUF6063 family protein [unclassified Paenibacillus]|uniref:DUF6063 family protein n=1 Tax=unclassified Paenibacillus TaxID=185978 RepID=UPI00277F6DE3|nr:MULTISPECIES: DUF6063 family protein [unclassified Paenibacillus]MDQ0896310.1 hypothetical protein [Paenibacillus sp. V4I7]MDQ0913762.1 hypothetical protein [Paenibacillus sp. V4I5]